MEDKKIRPTGDEIRITNFSQVMAVIFVTIVVVGSIISILFF